MKHSMAVWGYETAVGDIIESEPIISTGYHRNWNDAIMWKTASKVGLRKGSFSTTHACMQVGEGPVHKVVCA